MSVQNVRNRLATDDTCKCPVCKSENPSMTIEQCLDVRHKLSLSELIYFIDSSLAKCDELQDQIDPSCASSCSIEYPRSLIISLLELYASHHPHDWQKYESWNSSETYTRNLIAHHSNRFTLMLVCWKGGPSPVHNHAGSDCLMCVVQGIIRETKYLRPKDEHDVEELSVKEVTNFQEGEVHLINDQIGLHKMETVDENEPAVTLHCYIPPYFDCLIFDVENGEIKTNIAHTTYDTEFGRKSEEKLL